METLDSGESIINGRYPRIRGTKEERKGTLDKDTIVRMGIVWLPRSRLTLITTELFYW